MGELVWLQAHLYFARLKNFKNIFSLPTILSRACPSVVFVLPSMRQFRQALGTTAAIAVFIIPDATAMRQTFLCEVCDFPPNVRILVKLPSQRENSARISSVISSNKRAAGSLQQSSGSSKSRRVSAPYFQTPSAIIDS